MYRSPSDKYSPFICVLKLWYLQTASGSEVQGINIFCLRLLSETLITAKMVVGQINVSERRQRERDKVTLFQVPTGSD